MRQAIHSSPPIDGSLVGVVLVLRLAEIKQ
jgi:hypothetical protein